VTRASVYADLAPVEMAGWVSLASTASAISAADAMMAPPQMACWRGGAGWEGWRPSARCAPARGPVTAMRLGGEPWTNGTGCAMHRLAAANRDGSTPLEMAMHSGDDGGCAGGDVSQEAHEQAIRRTAMHMLECGTATIPDPEMALALLSDHGSFSDMLQVRSRRIGRLTITLWPSPMAPHPHPDQLPPDRPPLPTLAGGRWRACGALPCLDRALLATQLCAAFRDADITIDPDAQDNSAGRASAYPVSARSRRRSRMLLARHPLNRSLPRLDPKAKRLLAGFGLGLATKLLEPLD
jgi:hypothetical protein